MAVLGLAAGCTGGGSEPLSGPGDRPPKVPGHPPRSTSARSSRRHRPAEPRPRPGARRRRVRRLACRHTGACSALSSGSRRCPSSSPRGRSRERVHRGLRTRPAATHSWLHHVGQRAYYRAEKDDRSLHVFVHGSVLSLEVVNDPAHPVRRAEVLALGRAAAAGVPLNPQLTNKHPRPLRTGRRRRSGSGDRAPDRHCRRASRARTAR